LPHKGDALHDEIFIRTANYNPANPKIMQFLILIICLN